MALDEQHKSTVCLLWSMGSVHASRRRGSHDDAAKWRAHCREHLRGIRLSAGSAQGPPSSRPCRRRGTTLIEILVVVLLVSVVLGLSVGLLASIRDRGRDATSWANLRSHALAVTAYTSDFGSLFPYVTKVGFASTTFEPELPPVSYFDAHRTWHRALAGDYYNMSPRDRAFSSPHRRASENRWLYSDYFYPCVYIAHSSYWNPYSRLGVVQYQPTRVDQVSYPAQKILIIDSGWFNMGQSTSRATNLRVANVDGAATEIRPDALNNGYQRGEGIQFLRYGAMHFADAPPGLHTMDGIRGRDVRH